MKRAVFIGGPLDGVVRPIGSTADIVNAPNATDDGVAYAEYRRVIDESDLAVYLHGRDMAEAERIPEIRATAMDALAAQEGGSESA